MWSNPRERAAVDCGKTDQRDVRKEIVVGKHLWRKAGQPWKQGDTAESRIGGGAITTAPLSPQPASAAEQQRGWPVKRLRH